MMYDVDCFPLSFTLINNIYILYVLCLKLALTFVEAGNYSFAAQRKRSFFIINCYDIFLSIQAKIL